jgi:hypothetical protein
MLSSVDLYIGPHPGSGISFEFSQHLDINTLSYNYNTTSALTFSGISVSDSFSGTLEDPSSWSSNGEFKIGNVNTSGTFAPATIDATTDGDGRSYVAFNLPMSGSIRLSNLSFGGTDFGPVAIDGIHIEKLTIEIPGRGLGKP